MTECRLSIYGRNMSEWDKLSKWVVGNGLLQECNNWMIQEQNISLAIIIPDEPAVCRFHGSTIFTRAWAEVGTPMAKTGNLGQRQELAG